MLLLSSPAAGAGGHWPLLWTLPQYAEAALPPSRWSFEAFLRRVAEREEGEEKAAVVERYLSARRGRIPVIEDDC